MVYGLFVAFWYCVDWSDGGVEGEVASCVGIIAFGTGNHADGVCLFRRFGHDGTCASGREKLDTVVGIQIVERVVVAAEPGVATGVYFEIRHAHAAGKLDGGAGCWGVQKEASLPRSIFKVEDVLASVDGTDDAVV